VLDGIEGRVMEGKGGNTREGQRGGGGGKEKRGGGRGSEGKGRRGLGVE